MRVLFETKTSGIPALSGTAVGLGNFDGVHIGHAALIDKLVEVSQNQGLTSVIYTFMKHPENILRKKLLTPQITTTKKKIELLARYKVDYLYLAEFNEKFSQLSPEEFVKRILVDKLRVKLAVVGFDYRFGFEGSGNVAMLEYLGHKYNFDVVVVPPVLLDGEVVSSTAVREMLARGLVDKASRLLGRPYSIQGLVVRGRSVGAKLGFPTANIEPEKYLIIPRSGVYCTQTTVEGNALRSVTNIGKNPTFRLNRVSIETHILDFKQDIYDKTIEVFFNKRIRGEKKFNSIEELILQIKNDISLVRNTDISQGF